MNALITLIDWILFIPLALCVGYLFFFAIAGHLQKPVFSQISLRV